jgi:hypothetical protein
MAPLPGAGGLVDGAPDRDELRRLLAPWCLDEWIPPERERGRERPHRRPEPAVDRSVDPHTDVDPTGHDPAGHPGHLPPAISGAAPDEPGDHEQVADPPPPEDGWFPVLVDPTRPGYGDPDDPARPGSGDPTDPQGDPE